MSQEKYFGNWTVQYRYKGKLKLFQHLPGYTEAEAIKGALRYMAGFDVQVVKAWKEQRQLSLFGPALGVAA